MPEREEPTPQQIIDELRRDNERLREDLRRSEAERQRLRRENDKLKEDLEAARRTASRQAAPLSRGTRVACPRRPGRHAGVAYGRRAHRPLPAHIDETYEAPLPAQCPHCQHAVRPQRVAVQYQEELPVQRPRCAKNQLGKLYGRRIPTTENVAGGLVWHGLSREVRRTHRPVPST